MDDPPALLSEPLFSTTFELAPVGMGHLAPDGRVLHANGRLCEMLGYTCEELVGMRLQDLAHPDDLTETLAQVVGQLGRDAPPYWMEKRYVRGDGGEIWIRLGASVVRDAATAAPLHLVAVLEDITERRAAARAAEWRERELRSMLDHLPEVVGRVDRSGRYVYLSGSAEGLMGRPVGDLLGGTYGNAALTPQAAEEARECLWKAFRTGEPVDHARVIAGAQGEVRHTQTRLVPVRGADGRVESVVVIARERTDEVRARRLERAEHRYQALIEATSAAVWTATAEGLFEGPQPSWEALTGQTTREIGGLGWLSAVYPEDRKETLSAWTRAVAERTPYAAEHRVRTGQGEYRYLEARAAPVYGFDGRVAEWVGTETDITRRKLAEQTVRFQASLLEAVEQAVIATDLAGRITYWNTWAESLLGWQAAEAMGRSLAQLLPSTALPEQVGLLARLQAGIGWAGELELATREGRRFAGLGTAAPVRDEAGALVGVVRTLTDVTDLKEAGRALAESEERFRRLARAVPGLIFVMDVARRVPVYANRDEFLGWERDELFDLGLMWEQVHPDDREALAAAQDRLYGEGLEGVAEYRLRRKDGTWEWVENRLTVLDSTAAGEPHRTLSFVTVVTPRRRQEQALRVDHELLRRVLNVAPTAILVLGTDGTVQVSNSHCVGTADLDGGGAAGRRLQDAPAWNRSPRVRARLERAVAAAAAGRTVRYAETIRCPDGLTAVELALSPLRDAEGRVTHLVASIADVGAHGAARESLRLDEDRLRRAALEVGGVTREHDVASGRVHWGHGVAALLGRPEALAGTDHGWWLEQVHPDDRPRVAADFEAWLRGALPRWNARYRTLAGDGRWVGVHDWMSVVRNARGEAVRVVAVMQLGEGAEPPDGPEGPDGPEPAEGGG